MKHIQKYLRKILKTKNYSEIIKKIIQKYLKISKKTFKIYSKIFENKKLSKKVK